MRWPKARAKRAPVATSAVIAAILAATTLACTHHVSLGTDARWNYPITGPSLPSLVATVPATLEERSFSFKTSSAVGHSFIAQYGVMFVEVLQIELPQMSSRQVLSRGPAEDVPADAVVLQLDVQDYRFEDFRAVVRISAAAA